MTSMDDTLADVLQECLDRLAGGATVDQCVQRFPQQRLELEPMLQAVAALHKLPHPAMPVAAQAAIEARVLQQVALRRAAPPPHAASQPAAHPFAATWHGIPIWAMLLAVALLVALLLALGTLVGVPPTTSHATATPLATAQNPAPSPTGSLFSTPVLGAQSNDATPAPASTAASTPATPEATATGEPALVPVATMPPDAVLIPMATATPAPATGGSNGGTNTGGAPGSDQGAPGGDGSGDGTSGGDTGSNDNTCRGQQIGRDEKKCEPLKPPPHDGDPSGPKDDNGGKKDK